MHFYIISRVLTLQCILDTHAWTRQATPRSLALQHITAIIVTCIFFFLIARIFFFPWCRLILPFTVHVTFRRRFWHCKKRRSTLSHLPLPFLPSTWHHRNCKVSPSESSCCQAKTLGLGGVVFSPEAIPFYTQSDMCGLGCLQRQEHDAMATELWTCHLVCTGVWGQRAALWPVTPLSSHVRCIFSLSETIFFPLFVGHTMDMLCHMLTYV